MIQLPAYFTGFSSKSDGSASLRFSSQELSPNDFAELKKHHNAFGWLLFKNSEIQKSDVPEEDAIEEEDADKTPSKRLRAVLFRLWHQRKVEEPFDVWYRKQMEVIIDKVKEKLD